MLDLLEKLDSKQDGKTTAAALYSLSTNLAVLVQEWPHASSEIKLLHIPKRLKELQVEQRSLLVLLFSLSRFPL